MRGEGCARGAGGGRGSGRVPVPRHRRLPPQPPRRGRGRPRARPPPPSRGNGVSAAGPADPIWPLRRQKPIRGAFALEAPAEAGPGMRGAGPAEGRPPRAVALAGAVPARSAGGGSGGSGGFPWEGEARGSGTFPRGAYAVAAGGSLMTSGAGGPRRRAEPGPARQVVANSASSPLGSARQSRPQPRGTGQRAGRPQAQLLRKGISPGHRHRTAPAGRRRAPASTTAVSPPRRALPAPGKLPRCRPRGSPFRVILHRNR